MNAAYQLPPDDGSPSALESGVAPDLMLFELLTLHEEMIVQLRLELLGVRTAGFLTGLIVQHEKAAALLRAQLDNQEAPPPVLTPVLPPVIPFPAL